MAAMLAKLSERGERLDGVFIASPHVVHFEQAMAAIDHGLNVVVEKPMCTDAKQAAAITRAAAEAVVLCWVNNTANFTPQATAFGNGCGGRRLRPSDVLLHGRVHG